ncbi:MAG: hypothetical protein ACNA8L_08570 [Luteolibacter sp.]
MAIALGFFCLSAFAPANELPRKAPLTKYTGLWNNSPFTSRPVITPPEAPPEVNPLEDYSLIGISPVGDGFRVTLIDRNNPTERIIVDSTRPNPKQDIQILGVDRQPGRPLGTTVRLSMGRSTGTVGFEQAMLTLTPPPAATPQAQPIPTPGANPADAAQADAQGARRQPRPRVVPPPANTQPEGGQPGAGQGGRIQRPQGGTSRGDRNDRRSRR